MKSWTVAPREDLSGFEQVECVKRDLGPGEALVQLKAASLNFRDTLIAAGHYPLPLKDNLVPMSDGAWDVIAVGPDVARVKPGDRVINIFAEGWIDGPLEQWMWGTSYGAEIDGILTERKILPADTLVHLPDQLSFEEGATLPCAAVTAWTALFHGPKRLLPGQTVLMLGTGGVSVFAIQLASAAGMHVIATSSSDDKLDRVKKLGADIAINYKEQPDWDQAVLEATNGEGADVVVEVGGPGTFNKSVSALKHGGWVSFIGALADPTSQIDPWPLLQQNKTIHPVMVGNRRHTEETVQAIAQNRIKPVIDTVYDFDKAPEAFRTLPQGQHFGKLVITT